MSDSKDIADALASLMRQMANGQNSDNSLPKLSPRGDRPAESSSAAFSSTATATGDFTETNFADRTYYPAGWKTSDGLFTFPAIKTIKFLPTAGVAVTYAFKEPV